VVHLCQPFGPHGTIWLLCVVQGPSRPMGMDRCYAQAYCITPCMCHNTSHAICCVGLGLAQPVVAPRIGLWEARACGTLVALQDPLQSGFQGWGLLL
jgi:hypothetical protein